MNIPMIVPDVFCDLPPLTGVLALSSLKRGTDHAMAISLPPCVIRRAARLATTWRPSACSSPRDSRGLVISDRPLLCPDASEADVIYWDERLGGLFRAAAVEQRTS